MRGAADLWTAARLRKGKIKMTHHFVRILVCVVAAGCALAGLGCPFAAPIDGGASDTRPAPPAVEAVPADGACCRPDGGCELMGSIECEDGGGRYQEDGTRCATVVCAVDDEVGACCIAEEGCSQLSSAECANANGQYGGDGSDCLTIACGGSEAVGACCLAHGCVSDRTEEECGIDGGTYRGDDSRCTDPDVACLAEEENEVHADLEALNDEVDFGNLTAGTEVVLKAPDFTTISPARLNEGCVCSWSVNGNGTFAPESGSQACTTLYTPATDDTMLRVDVTCGGETRAALQEVAVVAATASIIDDDDSNDDVGGGDPCAGVICSDGNPCTADACIGGGCVFVPLADDTSCSDGNECTTDDRCAAGACSGEAVPDGVECLQNALFCDGVEVCMGGFCESLGTPCGLLSCNETLDRCEECVDASDCPDDDGNECTDAPVCDTLGDTSVCVYAALDATTTCDDGDPCSADDHCDGEGNCLAGGPVDCTGLDDECSVGVCNPTSGDCEAQPANAGDPCGDNVDTDCTDPDTCDEAGICQPNHAAVGASCGSPNNSLCDDPDTCSGNGNCQNNQAADGEPCPDSVICNGMETCVGGMCQPGTPDDALCDNGLFCDGAETCDAVLDCQAGDPPVLDDDIACTVDTCDEDNDVVVHTPNDALCDNGLFCDGVETCDAVLDCQAGTAIDCDDGLFCNGPESCVNDTCHQGAPPCVAGETCNEDGDSCDFAPTVAATAFLRLIQDQYHGTWLDVYTDAASAGNHFVHPAMMLGGVTPEELPINDAWTDQPHRGGMCIMYGFLGRGTDWGGFYRMNGMLRGDDVSPLPNWGTEPNAGLNLTGATELVFWVRGDRGGEKIEFFAFGVGRDPVTGLPLPGASYPGSSPKRSIGYITLTTAWQEVTIPLDGADLGYVLGGWGWVTNAQHNDNQDVVFYVDDVRYKLARPATVRLLQSFVPRDEDLGSATLLRNLATTYDNALAITALAAMDDLDNAGKIADALVYAQQHDRWFNDGRVRSGYQAGDLILPPGWEPHGRVGTVRIPGWWGSEDEGPASWHEDGGFVGSKTGDMAWAIIGLLNYREAAGLSGTDEYLQSALTLGQWIEAHCRSSIGPGGYTGGFDGWEPDQGQLTWKSTEHNLDVYVAFSRLHQITGDQAWLDGAQGARGFVEAMWNDADGHFWTGTTEDGVTINQTVIPLDVQAWSVLAFEGAAPNERAMDWAVNHCALENNGYQGFDYDTDLDGVWFEGTAHMALAYKVLGQVPEASFYLQELRRAQREDTYGDGLGLVATSKENLTTGFGTTYVRRLHVGATCWLVFAELNYNPYWPGP